MLSSLEKLVVACWSLSLGWMNAESARNVGERWLQLGAPCMRGSEAVLIRTCRRIAETS